MIHYDLQLRRGGFLVALEPAEDGSLVEAVVDLSQTPQALHQTMCVAPGATLGDVLRLVRDHKEMFSRLADAPCLDEFLADAFEREEEEELHDLEAVELGWASVVDIEDGTSVFVMETDMHGRDVLGAACGLEMTPLCQLVDVPFEIRDSLSVLDGRDPQQVLLSCNSPMTVLQVVRGVLEEVTYMGSPEQRDAERAEIERRIRKMQEAGGQGFRRLEPFPQKEPSTDPRFACEGCGKDIRCGCFGKPDSVCHDCFRKTKEN